MANLNDVVVNLLPSLLNAIKSASTAIQESIESAVINPVLGFTCTPITISTSGDNTIIVAPGASKHLAIMRVLLVAADPNSVNIILKSGSTALSGAVPIGQLVIDFDRAPLELGSNEAFVVNLSAAVTATGFVQYGTVAE